MTIVTDRLGRQPIAFENVQLSGAGAGVIQFTNESPSIWSIFEIAIFIPGANEATGLARLYTGDEAASEQLPRAYKSTSYNPAEDTWSPSVRDELVVAPQDFVVIAFSAVSPVSLTAWAMLNYEWIGYRSVGVGPDLTVATFGE
jgi:hypothetical protein